MQSWKMLLVVLLLFGKFHLKAQQKLIEPGKIWKDTQGKPINAHGGGILYFKGVYYWFGEIKRGSTWLVANQSWEDYRVPAGGISCYTSSDLINWAYKGIALSASTGNPLSDLDTGKVIERPKVLYNRRTRKFVMWMHIDANDYSLARAGVAMSERPEGPYHYIKSVRPNGAMCRDMTVFQDTDGKAYHLFSSENNATMHVCLLSDDYLSHTKNEISILKNASREAPAMFKHRGRYYLITSGCTGWTPNAALLAVADHPLGTWKILDNPCMGMGADSTFSAQGTFILPLAGKKDSFIFLADQWNKINLEDSRYIWLPLKMREGKPEIQWVENWRPETHN